MLGNKLRFVICVEKLSRGSFFFFFCFKGRECAVSQADRKDRYLHYAAEFEK
jgi:hypothetical protein